MKIEINQLHKVYKGGNYALRDVDLEITNGMFGLLGPNGAGKSTLMRILVTLMKPSDGSVLVNGMDLQKNRKKIRKMLGYLPQDFRFFSKLKTWEFLDYAGSLAGIRKRSERSEAVDRLLDQVGLFQVRDRQANKLSGGMKRRLGIAQALIGNPSIIIVDEPTTGLDPDERIRFRNILSDLSQKEVIIILSTHIVGDISSTCHDMALLNKGEVAFTGAPEELIDLTRGHVYQVSVDQKGFELLKEKYHIISTIPSKAGWDVQVVADEVKEFDSRQMEPNLEHAYVYFMENYLSRESHQRIAQ